MDARFHPLRALRQAVSQIGHAVRASQAYSRESADARAGFCDQAATRDFPL